MAMTELQQPDKTNFYQSLRNLCSSLNNQIIKCNEAAEFLNLMDADTLDNMGIPATGSDEGLRQDLVNIRTGLNNLVDWFETNLEATINKLRNF